MNVSRATDQMFEQFLDARKTRQEKHALFLLEDTLRSGESSIRDRVRWIRDRCNDIEKALDSDEASGAFLEFQRTPMDVDMLLAKRQNAWQMLAALLTEDEMNMLLAARRGARVTVK